MVIRAFQFAFDEGGELLEFYQGRFVNVEFKGINGGEELFNRDWCVALLFFLSLVAIASHVAGDTTMAASTSEFRFAISECLNFTFASFAAFAFRSPIVRGFSFLAPFSASVFIHSSPPSSLVTRGMKLEVAKFLAIGSRVISVRVESTFATLQVCVVLSVFLSCLELGYLEVWVACKTSMIEEKYHVSPFESALNFLGEAHCLG